MSIISSFAAQHSAVNYSMGAIPGILGSGSVSSADVAVGNSATGVQSITVTTSGPNGGMILPGGNMFYPFVVGNTLNVGTGATQETITITGVTQASLAGFTPVAGAIVITATFAQVHGAMEPVTSATYGLNEAVLACAASGGGVVYVTPAWYSAGGTTAMLQAASLPTNGSVRIQDQTATSGAPGQGFGQGPTSLTAISAPAAATSATVGSLTGVTGTWTASTFHVLFTYVAADGGETVASSDYSFTATANLAIGGSGPAAATGAVGYRVYIGANATTTCYMLTVNSTNGTVVQCGPIAAFKIGTPFQQAAITTSATNLPPLQDSTAFPIGSQPAATNFAKAYGPFTATGVVTAGTAVEAARFQLPAGYLNFVGRTLRLQIRGYFTPVSTATLIPSLAIQSVYGTTTTTIFTVTTPATSGTSPANFNLDILIRTATTGTAGTLECHGDLRYGGATGTAGLLVSAGDSVQAVSSAANLTTQDTLVFSLNSGTANLTTGQVRLAVIETLV